MLTRSHCAWILLCGSGEKQLNPKSEGHFRASATGIIDLGAPI